jgi:hypothetical protein
VNVGSPSAYESYATQCRILRKRSAKHIQNTSPERAEGGGKVRIILVSVVAIMALISAICPLWAQNQTIVATDEVATPDYQSREAGEDAAREMPALRKRIDASERRVSSLETAVTAARRSGNSGRVTLLQRELIKARLDILQAKGMPFGGYANQVKASENLQSMGYRTRGQLTREFDGRYVSLGKYEAEKTEATQDSQLTVPTDTEPSPATVVSPVSTLESTEKGGVTMSPWTFIGWSLACIPALAIVGVFVYSAVGNYRRFTRMTKKLVGVGTGSGESYEVKGNYGPFRVRYSKK